MHVTAILALTLSLESHSLPTGLAERIARDGRIVVEAHVALCDNAYVRCGGRGRGDGDDLRRNLYWATSGGLEGWFARRASPWRRIATLPSSGNELTTVLWRRRLAGGPWLRTRGTRRPVHVYVIAHAWRGRAIDTTWGRFLADGWGGAGRTITLPDGTTLEAGGQAHVVAYLGHNRLMDRDAQVERPRPAEGPVKGIVALACHTANYLAPMLDHPAVVPLVFTRDYVFPEAGALEGALVALVEHGSSQAIRAASAAAYARAQGKPAARVDAAFTNPTHARWPR